MTTATIQRSDLNVLAEQREQDHYNRERGTCLGAGCCWRCGRPRGLVRQKDGTYKQRCNCGG